MKILGVMALNRFPMWRECLTQLCKLSDKVCVRIDAVNGDPEIMRRVEEVCGDKLARAFMADGWKVPQWREDMLRLADEQEPDIVLCPDEDEIFGDSLAEELSAFYYSDKDAMMFEYDSLVTDDGRIIEDGKPYPPQPHMKAFKWRKNLSYYPYHGDAKIAVYATPEHHWMAKTKIRHFCAFTKAMEDSKHWRNDMKGGKATKAVTLIGFGPSARAKKETIGEVWSLNNCYESFTADEMRLVTRVFEMHKFDKRDTTVANTTAKWHIEHLDELGKRGTRIIMQTKHPGITNSEPYPIYQTIYDLGIRWFAGTPCYMVAMAIMEGFTHIRIFGLDQMDWEHTLQRECFAGWMMYAIGRGIQVSGALTWLDRYTKLYGYEYGPEWDDYQNNLLWMGHPMEVKYRIPSRVVDGKLYDGGKK